MPWTMSLLSAALTLKMAHCWQFSFLMSTLFYNTENNSTEICNSRHINWCEELKSYKRLNDVWQAHISEIKNSSPEIQFYPE